MFRIKYDINTYLRMSILLICFILLSGCLGNDQPILSEIDQEKEIIRYEGEMSRAVSYVYTGDKKLSLTFNGLADDETMAKLLDELDKYQLKATFFLPGMRVAEEPDLAREILNRGHHIENNTLNQLDMSELTYEQIYREIQLSNEVIEKETGVLPRYIRTRSGDFTENIRLAAAHLGMDAVIGYTINPRDSDMQSAEEIGAYVERFISRGGIITLHTNLNPEIVGSIQYIAKAASDIGYTIVPLHDLIESGGERKPLEQIEGYDAAKIDLENTTAEYELIYTFNTDEKKIALTLDDWASDQTITEVLDILAQYDVKATFFLRARGVEDNPNLARAIVEEGHEVANHSYNHEVVTTLTPQELQEDIVKAHQVLTEATQEQPIMLYRPPTGVIDDQSAKVIAATGYSLIAMYDVTTLDWDIRNSAEDIVQTIMDRTQQGSIILLHILDNTNTVEALPQAISQLQNEGFSFVKLSEVIGK
ncbi:polysaccharide deacetylase family protein [Bacillus horti]|uniref:Peptidoglycan/xylan/chitin deacetylase (PgdA/CDA1 family) n=1 Tax=Caldalkalibacillus horti TaxID=77523 RepID=A0ABT9W211_9BACI|nr:polysaccharide deacetylase family protein [Bacillus horti]MDQ0167293.1 peptidoglycan/xylan/chitin deacetylase (PgdA/CDA1 family) [Bacillus horti]